MFNYFIWEENVIVILKVGNKVYLEENFGVMGWRFLKEDRENVRGCV